MLSSRTLMLNAVARKRIIPSFNVSYLPMIEPIVRALRDANSFGQIAVSQVDWDQFEAGGPGIACKEYQKFRDERHTRIHLDHVPVVDEHGDPNDFETIIGDAIEAGYDSVMVDGSYLPLDDNIAATGRIVRLAQPAGVPVEAEVGAVLGYSGVPVPYEELFTSRKGFTDVADGRRLVEETGVDWLSVAVGNIHGALTTSLRNRKKAAARLDIEHLRRIRDAVGIPLVLHGGTGIPRHYIMDAMQNGIAKINIATAVRQAFEARREESLAAAQQAVHQAAFTVLTETLELADSADDINREHPQ